jgi:glycosyltransferase involved in cell wall biosynthesis
MSVAPALSVLLCTHNPRADHINETLAALRHQDPLPDGAAWELIVVDNANPEPLSTRADISLPPQGRIIAESRLGLTHARHRSFRESRGDVLVYVDDDNVLDQNYLSLAYAFMRDSPRLGALGGKALPRYEAAPPPWFDSTHISLACRDLGEEMLQAYWNNERAEPRTYPECAPIGAGMVLRRRAYETYVEETNADPVRLALGRRGQDLSSGEDNDMVMTMLKHGWGVAYRPELRLRHLISAGRLELEYLKRYAYASNRTWVQVLAVHGICPWGAISPLSAPLRKARAFMRHRPWRGPVEEIAWQGSRGLIDGRARIGGRLSNGRQDAHSLQPLSPPPTPHNGTDKPMTRIS